MEWEPEIAYADGSGGFVPDKAGSHHIKDSDPLLKVYFGDKTKRKLIIKGYYEETIGLLPKDIYEAKTQATKLIQKRIIKLAESFGLKCEENK